MRGARLVLDLVGVDEVSFEFDGVERVRDERVERSLIG